MKDPTGEELLKWYKSEDRKRLLDFWNVVDTRPRVSAKKMGVRLSIARLMAAVAINYAVYLNLEKKGEVETAKIYKGICEDIREKILMLENRG